MKLLDYTIRLNHQFEEISKLFKPDVLPHGEKISKIYKNIYIASGSWAFSDISKVNISTNFFQKILNLAPQEVEIGQMPTTDVYSIDLLDIYSENIYKYFETLNEFFVSNQTENILVTCGAGISRSAAVVLAHLLKQKFTLHNAINLMLSTRPQIRPNNGFLLQLLAYEINLQRNELEPLDLKSLDNLLSILPEYEKKTNKKAVIIIRKNDEWEKLYYLGFRKK